MNLKNNLFISLFVMSIQLFSQSNELTNLNIVNYNKFTVIEDTIDSKYLNQKRNFIYTVPENINQYTPIILSLDGNYEFNSVVGNVSFLSDIFVTSEILPSVIIGVGSKDRLSDYVTTNSENFRKFLFNEIISNIQKEYGLKGPLIIVGHSHGAEFIINSVIADSLNIDAIILVSPIIRNNINATNVIKKVPSDLSIEKINNFYKAIKKKNIIVTNYSSLNDGSKRRNSLIKMDSIFKNQKYPYYYSEIFKYGSHNTMFLYSIPHGLIRIFETFRQFENLSVSYLLSQEDIILQLDSIANKKQKMFNYFYVMEPDLLISLVGGLMENDFNKALKVLDWQKNRIDLINVNGVYNDMLSLVLITMAEIYSDNKMYDLSLKMYEKAIPIISENVSNKESIIKEYELVKTKIKD